MRLSVLPVAMLLAAVAPSAAAESFHTCAGFIDTLPAVITSQGTWCLRHDLATSLSTGVAITVQTNNVTIDCNGFKLGGLGAGEDMAEAGIAAYERRRVTVRRCTIRGFGVGIDLRDFSLVRGGHVVEDNILDFQTSFGVLVSGHDSLIQRNQLLSIGGSTLDPYTAAIETTGDVDVVDNLVADVLPARPVWDPDLGEVFGLRIVGNRHGTVSGNRIRRILRNPSLEPEAWAIRLFDSDNAIVEGNRMSNPDAAELENEVGAIRCSDGFAYLRDNIARSFSGPTHNCTDGGGNTGL